MRWVHEQLRLEIRDSTQVGAARRTAARLPVKLGLAEPDAGRLGLVVTEMATNIVKHARSGELLLRVLDETDRPGVEVLGIDRGPGMNDVARCLEDGYSTVGSPGTGLGAITRLSQTFDIYSQPGAGTILLSRIWADGKAPQEGLDFGAVCIAAPNETVAGDAWGLRRMDRSQIVLLADGLGHGAAAADAAREAVRVLRDHPVAEKPEALLNEVHAALRKTRGAAVAVVTLNASERMAVFAGVGNIAGSVVTTAGRRGMLSHHGTAGLEVRKIQPFVYPWPQGSLVVLHSDGLASGWDLRSYAALAEHHPAVVAALLYRDFRRGRDDVTVLVARAT